jgi:hypothetical protein
MSFQQCVKAGLLAAAVIASFSQAAVAAPGVPPGARMKPAASEEAGGTESYTERKVVKIYLNNGNGFGSALNAFTFNTIESGTVNCTNGAGCTVGQDSMVQLSPNGGNWAICLAVDGVYSSCQYQGNLPDVSSFVVGNAKGFSAKVPFGLHAVRTDVFVDAASTLHGWQTDTRVYKP